MKPGTGDAAFAPRLRLARHFYGLTQAELGERLDVSRQYVHQLESATKFPSDVLRTDCVLELGFEHRFFASPLSRELRDEECHFRKRQTTPLHVRSRVLAHGTLFAEFVDWLDRTLKLPSVSIPDCTFDSPEAIERAAEKCRLEWGVGPDAPIANVTRMLERVGVVIATFDDISEKVDAFSWHGPRPLVIRSTVKGDPARARFDVAHEAGHLVGHVGVATDSTKREAEADRFASALLLPRRGFVREFPRGSRVDWVALVSLKERWGASIQAIVRRAFDLRLISARQYQSCFIHISKRGWRTEEPGDVAAEPAEIVSTALGVASGRLGIPAMNVAAELGWSSGVLERLLGVAVGTAPLSNVVSLHGSQRHPRLR